jgi:hypothetical protein
MPVTVAVFGAFAATAEAFAMPLTATSAWAPTDEPTSPSSTIARAAPLTADAGFAAAITPARQGKAQSCRSLRTAGSAPETCRVTGVLPPSISPAAMR